MIEHEPLGSQPSTTADPAPPEVPAAHSRSLYRKMLFGFGVVALLVIVAVSFWLLGKHSAMPKVATTTSTSTTPTQHSTEAATLPGLQLDVRKNYGDKYAKGILPVGDGKYTTSGAAKGSIYACSSYAGNLQQGGGGASVRGPWFTNNNTSYDLNKKVYVSGSVTWHGSFTNTIAGSTRTITTNDLPNDHVTGIFPIKSSDTAYAYDRNPNTITAQSSTYALSASPTYGNPNCMGGQVGVMLTGVALFNAFDAGGRDAGAWEVQDGCDGHPERTGVYHYHTLSSCIKDTHVQTVIGFALDGFPITGPKVGSGNILTTSDLDECHGITSQITLDGKLVTMYHYVMTQDFPYSASCFRSQAIQPPGLEAQQGQQQQAGPPPQGY